MKWTLAIIIKAKHYARHCSQDDALISLIIIHEYIILPLHHRYIILFYFFLNVVITLVDKKSRLELNNCPVENTEYDTN